MWCPMSTSGLQTRLTELMSELITGLMSGLTHRADSLGGLTEQADTRVAGVVQAAQSATVAPPSARRDSGKMPARWELASI